MEEIFDRLDAQLAALAEKEKARRELRERTYEILMDLKEIMTDNDHFLGTNSVMIFPNSSAWDSTSTSSSQLPR